MRGQEVAAEGIEGQRLVGLGGLAAGFVARGSDLAPAVCADHLTDGHPWVREPLVEWLGERWAGTRGFGYRVEGDDPAGLTVSRL